MFHNASNMKERAREIADQWISGEVKSLHRKFSSPQFKRDCEIAKVHWLVLIMVKMKELVCCKEVLQQASKDLAVQSRHEVEAAEERMKIFFVCFWNKPPWIRLRAEIFFWISSDRKVHVEHTGDTVLLGSKTGSARATRWCKVGVSTAAAAEAHAVWAAHRKTL